MLSWEGEGTRMKSNTVIITAVRGYGEGNHQSFLGFHRRLRYLGGLGGLQAMTLLFP
jgi:hypothetical protein